MALWKHSASPAEASFGFGRALVKPLRFAPGVDKSELRGLQMFQRAIADPACYNRSMLTAQVREDMKTAMKAREELRLSVIRGMITAFTNELVAKGRKPTDELSDEEAIVVLKRLAKQRTDSAEQFEKGGRKELAEKEISERAIIEAYLPAKASRDQIEKVAREKMVEMGIAEKAGMGKLMGSIMKALGSSADGNDVKAVLADLLK